MLFISEGLERNFISFVFHKSDEERKEIKKKKLLLLYSRVVREKIFHTAHLLSGDEREIDGGKKEKEKKHENAA